MEESRNSEHRDVLGNVNTEASLIDKVSVVGVVRFKKCPALKGLFLKMEPRRKTVLETILRLSRASLMPVRANTSFDQFSSSRGSVAWEPKPLTLKMAKWVIAGEKVTFNSLRRLSFLLRTHEGVQLTKKGRHT